MMTSRRRHNRAPLRRSSAPQKFLAGGLAVAVCAGIIGVIGVRSIRDDEKASTSTTEVDAPASAAAQPIDVTSPEAATVVSTEGLTREQLDDYAAALAAEKHRLDVYRVELIRVAKELQSGGVPADDTSVSTSTVPEAAAADVSETEGESTGATG